jgi:hypothetical protein
VLGRLVPDPFDLPAAAARAYNFHQTSLTRLDPLRSGGTQHPYWLILASTPGLGPLMMPLASSRSEIRRLLSCRSPWLRSSRRRLQIRPRSVGETFPTDELMLNPGVPIVSQIPSNMEQEIERMTGYEHASAFRSMSWPPQAGWSTPITGSQSCLGRSTRPAPLRGHRPTARWRRLFAVQI